MNRLYIITALFLITLITLLATDRKLWAESSAYVTDSIGITCRTGPDITNKIIAMLHSGDHVRVIETRGNWSKVKFLKKDGTEAEGWVMSRYLMTDRPCRDRAAALAKENATLKKQLSELKADNAKYSETTKTLKKDLDDVTSRMSILQKKYQNLKEGAAGYITLKKKYEETSAKLDTAERKLNTLTREVNDLRSSHGYKWFGMGALVLFAGIILGLVFGRQKKSRSSLYY